MLEFIPTFASRYAFRRMTCGSLPLPCNSTRQYLVLTDILSAYREFGQAAPLTTSSKSRSCFKVADGRAQILLSASNFSFALHHADSRSHARRGTLHTPHGSVELPAFMPVGTAGTVKGLTIDQVRASRAQIVLANTYHLTLRRANSLLNGSAACTPSWVGTAQSSQIAAVFRCSAWPRWST